MLIRQLILVVVPFLILAGPVRAEEIRLKNGSVIHGRIVREDKDFIVVDLGRGRLNIARKDVVSIRRTAEDADSDDATGSQPAARGPVKPTRQVHQTAPRRPGRTPAGATPRVVPVERTPQPKAPSGKGPESAPPSRATSRGSNSRPSKRASATPDW